jgi:ectoine hydroxylase-related dioxygenase (phytanoyl-CoA dioxygenase family)
MTPTLTKLSAEQIAHYNEQGFVVVPDLLSEAEVNAFVAGETEWKNKPGFGLHGHTVDPQYRYLSTHPNTAGLAMQLLKGRVRIVQTMYLNKPPKGGQGIAMHQDSLYLPNDPNTLTACWVALTDTDAGNGGLCIVPGSHRLGLQKWHKNVDEKEHASWETVHDFRDRDGRMWKQTLVSFEIDGIKEMNVVKLAVPRGAGVFFTGLTIHGSFANTAPDRPRKAFAIHYVHEDTWLYRTDVQNTMPVEMDV